MCLCNSFSEKSNLAVTLVSSNDEVSASAAFFDFPTNLNVDQSKWEILFQENFETIKPTVSFVRSLIVSIY